MGWKIGTLMALTGAVVLVLSAACSDDAGDDISDTPGASMTTTPVADDIDRRIDAILADGGPSFGDFNRDELRRMIEIEEDAPFYMVNLIKFREFARYPDGRDATLSGREANARYNALPIILEIGARPVFVAETEQQLLGDDTTWDQVAIVLYPSREAFVSMLERADFQDISIHKDAGVEKSIVMVTEARELPAIPPVADPSQLPFPATAEDKPFTMVHVMQFAEQVPGEDGGTPASGLDTISEYEQAVAIAALPLGIRPAAILDVKGVLVGDGRVWDQVRLNRFPSHGAFGALRADPNWKAQQANRAEALADTYALMTLPIIDAIGQQ